MFVFFFNDTATTEIYTLSLPDALPIWGEVEVHLVAGLDEVVDRRDPLGDAAGADVEHPGVVLGHDREADAGAAPRVELEQLPVDVLGGEGGLGRRQLGEGRDQVGDVVADQRVDRAVAVLAEVVDPALRVALVRLGLGALPGDVPAQVTGDLLDVGEDGDRVGVALLPRDVAVRAGHGAPVGGRGGDPVRRAAVGPGGQRLLDAEHQRLGLDAHPALDVALVAEIGRAHV